MTDEEPKEVGGHLWLLLPVAWMTGLYALSSMRPGTLPGPADIPHLDKVAHMVVYCGLVLSFLPWGARRRQVRSWLPFAVGTALGFALADEFHQASVPGREPELLDLVADLVGICVAGWVCSAGWSRKLVCRILGWN